MLLKIYFLITLACIALADKDWSYDEKSPHKLSMQLHDASNSYKINLLPSNERPELNPEVSALINEDVKKSIEAKRAVEKDELKAVIAELGNESSDTIWSDKKPRETVDETHMNQILLTTTAPKPNSNMFDHMYAGYGEDDINLNAAGSENNKKSRIEIKKGPNGQEYEYEYAYYYEDEEEDSTKTKAPAAAIVEDIDSNLRGKSRYSTIERTTSVPTENSLTSAKGKGRASNIANSAENVKPENLPAVTRFPMRDMHNEVQPTPPMDSQYLAMEKKRISVKRPSLELVDSETFNTDEKQIKGSPRNGDTEANKTPVAMEEEAITPVQASNLSTQPENKDTMVVSESETEKPNMPNMGLELQVLMNPGEPKNDLTTLSDESATTTIPLTTNSEGDETLTTFTEPSTTTVKTVLTSTTTEAPTQSTTTTTEKVSLFGGKRPGSTSLRRHSFKPKSTAEVKTVAEPVVEPVVEPSAPIPQPKTTRNRFSRPPTGSRSRLNAKTTAAPDVIPEKEKEKTESKNEKAPSAGTGRDRTRNRFDLRGSTVTEKSVGAENKQSEDAPASSTVRTFRKRPKLSYGSQSRTTQAPVSDESKNVDADTEIKSSSAPVPPSKPTRFNKSRTGGSRIVPRKFGQTTESRNSDDSASDSTQELKVLNKSEQEEESTAAAGGSNNLQSRMRTKSESVKPKPTLPPRKVNPLLAKRRLQLGSSTTASPPEKTEDVQPESEGTEEKVSMDSMVDDKENLKDSSTEETMVTTKPVRGLNLLGQRRRLPLRKPGTIL